MKSRKRRYAELVAWWLLAIACIIKYEFFDSLPIIVVCAGTTYRYLNERAYQRYCRDQARAKKVYQKKFGGWYWLAVDGWMIPLAASVIAILVQKNMTSIVMFGASIMLFLCWSLALECVLNKEKEEE